MQLRRLDQNLCSLAVTDNGAGLPLGFDPKKTPGLGMKVVLSLVHRLIGTLSYLPVPARVGTKFDVTIQVPSEIGVPKRESSTLELDTLLQ